MRVLILTLLCRFYETVGAAGADIRANFEGRESTVIPQRWTRVDPYGFAI